MSYLSIPNSQNLWFIGCTHFYHDNIIHFCARPFENALEMNNVLVENLNSKVKSEDFLVHLGDFAFGKDKIGNLTNVLERIKCKNIAFVLGNHDPHHKRHELEGMFNGMVYDYLEVSHKNKLVVCSHYPHEAWNESHRGSYHVHSHVHYSFGDSQFRRFDAGVDNPWTNYGPTSFDWLIEHLKDKEVRTFDKGKPGTPSS